MAVNDVNIRIRAQDDTKDAFGSVTKSLGGLRSAIFSIQGAIGGLIGGVVIKDTIALADAYTSVTARLRLVSASTQEFTSVQKALFDSAQNTRSSFEQTVNLYSTLRRSTKDLGVSQERIVALTEGIGKALTVSGASGASAEAALIQLGQGFAAGALRGQEFMSVAEQAPMILDVLAKGLGKTRGELKKMADEGLLTTTTFIEGFSAGSKDLDKQFQTLPVTVDGAMTRIQNAVLTTVGSMDQLLGATSKIADAFSFVARGIETLNVGGDFMRKKELAGYASELIDAKEALDAFALIIPTLKEGSRSHADAVNKQAEAQERYNKALFAFRGAEFTGQMAPPLAVIPKAPKPTITKEQQKEIDKYNQSIVDAEAHWAGAMTQSEKQARNRLKVIEDTHKEMVKVTKEQFSGYLDQSQRTKRQEALPSELEVIREEIEKSDKAIMDANKLKFEGYLDPEQRGKRQFSLPSELEAIRSGLEASKSPLKQYAESVDNLQSSLQNVALSGLKSMEDALVGLVNGTMSAKDAFRSMATSIINDLIRIMIQKSITGPIAGAMDTFFSGGGKAIGGSVQAGKPYMVGERGAEMFVPNQSGSIIPNNQLSGGGGTTIVQNINVTTGVQQTVRAEIMTLMPQIANAAKSAVADAKLRGGSYAAAMR